MSKTHIQIIQFLQLVIRIHDVDFLSYEFHESVLLPMSGTFYHAFTYAKGG